MGDVLIWIAVFLLGGFVTLFVIWALLDMQNGDSLRSAEVLYTTPPQRPWVGLTEEEVKEIVGGFRFVNNLPYEVYADEIRAIEAALRSKNELP